MTYFYVTQVSSTLMISTFDGIQWYSTPLALLIPENLCWDASRAPNRSVSLSVHNVILQCYCPQSSQESLALTSALLENIRVHAKGLWLEGPKASSPLGARLSFLTNIMLYFVTQVPEEVCLDQSLIKSLLKSICWLLCPPANHSTKIPSAGTYWIMQGDSGDFPRRRHFLISTYLFNKYLFNNNCIPTLSSCYPEEFKS